MAPLFQLATLGVMMAGYGYGLWFLLGRPPPRRALTWLWCGLGGFCGQVLLLQAMVYANWPLQRTGPWVFGLGLLGLAGLIRELLRRRRVRWGWPVAEVLMVAGAAGSAALIQAAAFGYTESDRFIGAGQIDQLDYVLTSQFLVEQPFSTEWEDIGLHPWLYRGIGLKHERIGQCMVLGETAVFSHSDCQRVWGATTLFLAGLLAAALAGALRVTVRMPVAWSAVAGGVGASLPAVTTIMQLGYFSQHSTLFIMPALLAVCRPSALPMRATLILTALFLGYLASAYTEFFPLGAGLAGLLLLLGPGGWSTRLVRVALVIGAALVLMTRYLEFAITFMVDQYQSKLRVDSLAGFAPEGGTWVGWGRYFSGGTTGWVTFCGLAVVTMVGGALVLLPRARRRWWLAAGLTPGLLAATFALQPKLPAYAFHKLCSHFSPLAAILAATGLWLTWRRLSGGWRLAVLGLAVGAGAVPVVETLASNLALQREYRKESDPLWAARARAEAAPPERSYLIGGFNGYTGGWLAYFARHLPAYYEQPVLADRRVPTESLAFRRIPPGVSLHWIDLVRTGTAEGYEPSPVLTLTGSIEQVIINRQAAYVQGAETTLIIRRSAGFEPLVREFILEVGVTPLPGAAPGQLEVIGPAGRRKVYPLNGPMLLLERLPLVAGENQVVLRVKTERAPPPVTAPMLVLQSLSLEHIPNPKL